MIISIEDYTKKFIASAMIPYLMRVSENSARCGLVQWDDTEAFMWAGAYDGDFVAFAINDFSNHDKLPSTLELDVKQYDYIRTQLSLWPHGTARKYFPDIASDTSFYEYLECYVGETKCSSSNYDTDQLRDLICRATLQEISYYQNALAETLHKRAPRWNAETPTKEFPFRVYLYGTDDFSMSKLCSSLADCNKIIEDISENPRFATLDKYNFHFSN